MDSDFTPETLETAFLQLKSQLELVSETYKKADELARNLSPQEDRNLPGMGEEPEAADQNDGSEEGYRNVCTLLVVRQRRNGTCRSAARKLRQQRPGRDASLLHPQPKQDRSIGPGGKVPTTRW